MWLQNKTWAYSHSYASHWISNPIFENVASLIEQLSFLFYRILKQTLDTTSSAADFNLEQYLKLEGVMIFKLVFENECAD